MRTSFYPRWILANALAEGIGLGGTFVLGYWLSLSNSGIESTASILGAAVLAIAGGVLLEGVVVGLAQAWALRSLVASITTYRWVVATAIGAGIAWLLGMVPSTVMALMPLPEVSAATWKPDPLLQYGLAALMGAVLGPILGVAQWFVLRDHVPQSGQWLLANAAAWAVGMPMIFVGMEFVPWDAGGIPVYGILILTCTLCGGAVGAIHGRWLLRMKSEPTLL